jgi:hypothetical protein
LQTEIALSTTESEYIALSQAMHEVVPLLDRYGHIKFYGRIQKLKDLTAEDPALAERIDRDWHRASLAAGKQARKLKKTWWSSTLAKAKQQTNLLRTLLSMLRQKRDWLGMRLLL